MKLSGILHDKKSEILSLWIERTLDSYSSSGFFKKSRDHIANPTGANIKDGLTGVLDLLLARAAIEEYAPALDQVIRIRAVQDFSPSRAVVIFPELKWVIRQVLGQDILETGADELAALDCEIDRITLAAFDIYTECREQLYRIRIHELKSGRAVLTDSPCSSRMLRQDRGVPENIN